MTEKELEKAIKKIYSDAYVDLAYKTEAYFKASELRDKKMKQDLLNGVITEKEYNTWKINQTLIGKRWEEYSDVIATDMLNADNLAREAIKGNLAFTMAEGMNRAMWEASKIGTLEAGFTLYDKNAVLRLIKEQPEILPALKPDSPTERDIREGRIKRWNKQHLRSELTQGILQGESTGKIAKRMQNVVGMEQRASMRNARTAMTSAFNAGKEVGYKEAEDMGIELEQMWVAIYDDRTRHEHRMLDGQIRKVGEPFEIDGYEIGFPGDPSGEPEMVYNCRCRVVAITAGLKAVDPDIYKRPANLETEEQEYEEWKHKLEKKEEQLNKENQIVPPTSEWKNIIKENSENDYKFDKEMLKLEKKTLGKLSDEQIRGIRDYTGSSYKAINRYLRGNKSELHPRDMKTYINAKEGLQKTTIGKQMVLRRGTSYGEIAGFMSGDHDSNKQLIYDMLSEGRNKEVNNMFKNQVHMYKSFTSTSSNWDRGFHGDLEVLFLAPENTKGSSIMSISQYGTAEGECLLAPETRVKWLGLEESDDKHMGSKFRLFLQVLTT